MTIKPQKQPINQLSWSKKPLVFLLCLFVVGFGYGQINLVPNFSFEEYTNCPDADDQIEYATDWFKCSSNSLPENTTPDYYNACSSDALLGVPKNINGFQFARRNCNAYLGLATFHMSYPTYREYAGIQLSTPLVVGQKYFLSFYTVMGGDLLQGGYYYTMPTDKIGMRLATIPFNENNPTIIDNFVHLSSQNIISDTLNWTRISGSIIADSAYAYLMLGNFFDDANTDTVHLNCPECQNTFGYFLVDDVCVSTDSLFCNGGIDALPCTLGLNELGSQNEVSVSPNPVTDFCTVSLTGCEINEVFIYNLFGKMILNKKVSGHQVNIDFSEYPQGIYMIKVTTENNNSITRKIIKT